MLRGIGLSAGIAIAPAYRALEARYSVVSQGPTDPAAEQVRFEAACVVVSQELEQTIHRIAKEVSESSADIFRAHRALLHDPAILTKVKTKIHAGRHVIDALQETLQDYEQLFAQVKDEYLRERVSDIRDVIGRLTSQLVLESGGPKFDAKQPVILVASEILPSQAVMFDKLNVVGIVTEAGGPLGHAAILARSRGIPAVSGLTGILSKVNSGETIIIDGRDGIVLLQPGTETLSAYRKLQREYAGLSAQMIDNRHLPAETADGVPIELFANINNVFDSAAAVGRGATGVGLLRTEFLFLTHPSVPTEDEQVRYYRNIIEACPVGPIVIRTLDLGGDKQVPYLGHDREANPFMGWRSIRLMKDYPDLFQAQLRAILRVSIHGDVRILFPMISRLEEVREMKERVEEARQDLKNRDIPIADHIPFGVMIEVPSAALCIHEILEIVDFVSIGSNDLTQYLMAADRDNPKVAHLVDPCYPAVLRLLRQLIASCTAANKPVTLCGEMAGSPRCMLPLLGMGLRRFSMAPAFLANMKEMARKITLSDARQAAETVLSLKTVAEVRDFLDRRVLELAPTISKLVN